MNEKVVCPMCGGGIHIVVFRVLTADGNVMALPYFECDNGREHVYEGEEPWKGLVANLSNMTAVTLQEAGF